jgi:hypothetical protein
MKWNIDRIAFLHQPEFFLGSFDSPQMQARHEAELEKSLKKIKSAIALEADPLKALYKLSSKDHIQFVINNLDEFRHHGRLEETVIYLYGKLNAPFSSGGDPTIWRKLFDLCNRDTLKNYGKPFPSNYTRVYRGSISGLERSLAWTPDRKRTEMFAERWKDPALGGGHLYEVDIVPDHVLVYLADRSEEMVILSPDFIETAEIRPFSM